MVESVEKLYDMRETFDLVLENVNDLICIVNPKENYKIEVAGRNLDKLNKFESELGVKIDKSLIDGFNIENKKFGSAVAACKYGLVSWSCPSPHDG